MKPGNPPAFSNKHIQLCLPECRGRCQFLIDKRRSFDVEASSYVEEVFYLGKDEPDESHADFIKSNPRP